MEEELISILSGLGYRAAWGSLGKGVELPRIVLNHASGFEDQTLDGGSGWIDGRVQLDVYGDSYLQALTVMRAVRATLSGYSGGTIWSMALDAIRGRPNEDGGEVIQRISLDFAITYRG